MYTTTDKAKGVRRDPAPTARAITERLLAHRKRYVPHALNGRPTPTTNGVAAQIRKDMQSGKSAEVRRLLVALQDDVSAGVPLPVVLSILDDMRAYLMLCAGDLPVEPRDLAVRIQQETRADGRLDMAENAVLMRPGDPSALADLVKAGDDYRATLDSLMLVGRAHLIVAQAAEPCRVEITR